MRVFFAAFTGLVGLLAACSSHAQETEYQRCLNQANSAPKSAIALSFETDFLSPLEALHCQAEARLTLEEFEVAAALFQHAEQQLPIDAVQDRIFLWRQAAFAWEQVLNTPASLLALDQVLLLVPDDYEAIVAKASLLVELDDLEAALETLLSGEAKRPTDGDLKVFRATVLRRLDRLDEAAAVLIRAGDFGLRDQSFYLLELGLIEAARGNLAAAKQAWQALVEQAPYSDAAALANSYLGRVAEPDAAVKQTDG